MNSAPLVCFKLAVANGDQKRKAVEGLESKVKSGSTLVRLQEKRWSHLEPEFKVTAPKYGTRKNKSINTNDKN